MVSQERPNQSEVPQQGLKAENRFPNCVLMKLHSTPVQPEESITLVLPAIAQPLTVSTRKVNLKLTIRFGRQTIKVPGGQVEFGLKRGMLSLKLDNGKIPLEKMRMTAPFQLAIEVEEQRETGRESEANIAIAPSVKAKDTAKSSTKTKYIAHQVSSSGTEEEPTWTFEAKAGGGLTLMGQLTEELLGIVEVDGTFCSAEASFAIQEQLDIHLFDSKGLIAAKNLSHNRTALLTREFLLRFIMPKLQPHLSQVQGQL